MSTESPAAANKTASRSQASRRRLKRIALTFALLLATAALPVRWEWQRVQAYAEFSQAQAQETIVEYPGTVRWHPWSWDEMYRARVYIHEDFGAARGWWESRNQDEWLPPILSAKAYDREIILVHEASGFPYLFGRKEGKDTVTWEYLGPHPYWEDGPKNYLLAPDQHASRRALRNALLWLRFHARHGMGRGHCEN